MVFETMLETMLETVFGETVFGDVEEPYETLVTAVSVVPVIIINDPSLYYTVCF